MKCTHDGCEEKILRRRIPPLCRKHNNERLLKYYHRPSSAPSSSSSSSSSSSFNYSLLPRPASASPHTPLSPDRRLAMVALSEADVPKERISSLMNVTETTIDKHVDHYHKEGTVADLPRSGRPRIINDEDRALIVGLSLEVGDNGKKRYSTVKEIKNELELDCSTY
jgi:hypothetical protein